MCGYLPVNQRAHGDELDDRKDWQMNHKATAQCKNGHSLEWGSCKAEVKKLFGGTKVCGSKGFEQLYADGTVLTVSFGNAPWVKVRCVGCKTEFASTKCPQCGVEVPVSAFGKKGLTARMG